MNNIDEKIEYTIEKAIVSSYNLQVTYKSKKYIISEFPRPIDSPL